MNKLLLLIDIQNDYFKGGANPLVGSLEAAQNAAVLINHFRELEEPIYYVLHDGGEHASFFRSGTPGIKLNPLIEPHITESVIIKCEVNAFLDTTLKHQLKIYDAKHLIICGMMTHMCVDATVRAASDMGYTCTVISDACATKDLTFKDRTVAAADVQAAFLAALDGTFATVLTTEEFIGAETFNGATA